jgi:polyketide cyclase/dehydrase/lipid transport protein
MAVVRIRDVFSGTVHEAERCWYDTNRWPAWVDGLAEVSGVEGDWPQVGGVVTWSSGPAGRGRVIERVVGYEQLVGQTVEVQDDAIRGRQSVFFTPADGEVEVDLSLEYQLRKRSIVTPLVDALFIRRAMAASLRSTLTRFGAELAATRGPDVG